MAVIYITEYNSLGGPPFAPSQAPVEPPLAAYSFAITAGSTTPAAPNVAFQSTANLIRIHTDAICSVAIGKAPTAVVTANRMAANQTEYKTVPAGQLFTIAVITNT